MSEEFDLVIALDIGSRYSGYACQTVHEFKSNPYNIYMNKKWGQPMELCKTPTSVLISSSWVAESFGYKAEFKFCQEYDQDREKVEQKWFFFKDFKMALYTENFHDSIRDDVEDYFSRKKPIADVMSKFIELLKTDCLKKFGNRENISEKRIRWVVTVPAIWTDHAKRIMRNAAEKAGIPGEQLVLALEPEAAAIHCMFMPEQERLGMDNLGIPGDKILVVDLGGGTMDVTGVEVLQDRTLMQIVQSNGGPWGGQSVNDAFMRICRDAFKSRDGTELFKNCKKADLLKVEQDFEKQKIEASEVHQTTESSSSIEVDLPDDIKENMLSKQGMSIDTDHFIIKPSGFFFSQSVIKDLLYSKIINKIKEVLRRMLESEEMKGMKKVILVGGLSESSLILKEIREVLNNIPLFVPTNPFAAVLKGAVLYGQDPSIIRERISQFTYGIGSEGGDASLSQTFSASVRRGHRTTANFERSFNLNRFREIHPQGSSNEVNIPIFHSQIDSPTSVADECCRQLGIVKFALPDISLFSSLDFVLIHGGTELKFKIVNRNTGQQYEATFDISQQDA